MANNFGDLGKKTLADTLPVLAYPAMSSKGDRRLVMTSAAPTRATLYQDDVTLIEYSLPGGFVDSPSMILTPQAEVYLRFYNSRTRQQDCLAGVGTSMSFIQDGDRPRGAEVSIMFSGAGSRNKITQVFKDLTDSGAFESVDTDTEQTQVRNMHGEVVGVATGPTTIIMWPSARVKEFAKSHEPNDRYVHELTKEMIVYFSRASESSEAFRKLLEAFSIDEIVSGLRHSEIKTQEEEILRVETARLAAVAASLSRRRLIKIRRPD